MSDFAILAYYKRGGETKDAGDTIQDVFWMDATVSIAPTRTATVTKHPTEDRANISDHVILDNVVINVTGYVSNAPITSVPGNVIPQGRNRVQEAYTQITELYKERRPTTVIAELESFENCILTKLGIPQDVTNAEAIKIDMTFEQVRIATASTATEVLAFNTTKGNIDAKANDNGGTSLALSDNFSGAARTKAVLSSQIDVMSDSFKP